MKGFYLVTLILVSIIGVTYWYQTTASSCPAPLAYRVGDVDASFDLSKDEAKQYALEAELYWEEAIDRELFKYEEEAEFTINFVFDERQETANNEAEDRSYLDKKWDESEEVRLAVESLQAEYQSLSLAYETQAEAYESDLKEYNTKVNKYNDRGGAPSGVYQELEKERVELNQESNRLNRLADELNDFVTQINNLSERGNSLVESYNREVSKYNSAYGFAREFTQGDFQGDGINIYKFSSDEEVVTVLAHEFGHALGMDHVEDPSSLMYYLLGDSDTFPILSTDDVTALVEVCGEDESSSQKIRRIIRDIINLV